MTKQFIARGAAISLVFAACVAWSQQTQIPGGATAVPPALDGPVVKTEQGKVQGFVANGVAVFRGLPFAAPPVGDLRWREPKAPPKWSDVRAANVYGGNCQQVEDCLYLNIYMPANATLKSKLPVMVWIHGGAFVFGSGATYDGTQFAKQDVVVVTVNYRLGRAGWFAHPALTSENPKGLLGNYGVMDQVAALRWVQENIKDFGGDTKNVTIFGESAGAISINYLMLAPQARGLFHKAIAESGFGRMLPQPLHGDAQSAEQVGAAFAERMNVKGIDAAAAKALRELSWQQLTGGQGGIGAADAPRPIADGKMIVESAVEGFSKGKQTRVPYLVGGNSDEASLTRRSTNAVDRFAAITNRREEFLSAFDPDKSGNADRIVARLVTDVSISEPDRALARAHAKLGLPVYVYHFSYIPISTRDTSFGLAHGGEISYVFNNPRAGTSFDEEGKPIAEAANKYWAAFAKMSDPSSAGGPQWPKFTANDESLMEFGFGGRPVVQKDFHKARLDWVEKGLPK
ncbi:MAG TPA: carboxylesterase family protein [Steroidobacteraceae bacterium]|nr:carboxylesterase family protein [Steroidobacteraceae bacterium]